MASQGRSAARDSDPLARQVGTVYARALVGACEAAGQTTQVLEEFESFVSDVLDPSPDFEAVLNSARITPDAKHRILDRTIGAQASTLFLNFLKVMARHGRLNFVRATLAQARLLVENLRGRTRVEVASAAPLDEASTSRVAEAARRLVGGEAQLVHATRPELIGGVVLRIGDTIYDGSVATRLARLRGQMLQRSIHEIQRGRDRFRHPAGD